MTELVQGDRGKQPERKSDNAYRVKHIVTGCVPNASSLHWPFVVVVLS
ncbi:MAG: hypothetical protein JWN95_768 [Frankiales bacterium]|nr:hypothetical protein [Frankiales bacterium]